MRNEYRVEGDVLYISLFNKEGKKFEALVSSHHLPMLLDLDVRWYPYYDKRYDTYYVKANLYDKRFKHNTVIQIHRVVTNAPKGKVVDHKNRNPLDNTDNNLRVVTVAQNNQNKKLDTSNKNGIRGLYFDKRCSKWYGQVTLNKKTYTTKYCEDREEAIELLDQLRKSLHDYYIEGK